MTQRNPLNDRNTGEKTGQTRKSAASAKPKSARAATVRDPAPKSAKQKRAEAKERQDNRYKRSMELKIRFEDTPRYKHLRRYWWGFLIGAFALTGVSMLVSAQAGAFFSENPGALFLGCISEEFANRAGVVFMVAAYGCIVAAFAVDLSKVNKARREFENTMVKSNSKEMRRSQKQHRAELREQERLGQEEEANKKDVPEEKPTGIKKFLARFAK